MKLTDKRLWQAKDFQDFLFRLGWDENDNKPVSASQLIAPNTVMPDMTKLWGIDISDWNGETDLATAKANGCGFVIIKGADGSIPTKHYLVNKQRAKDANMPWGSYVWLYPNNKVSIQTQVLAWWNLFKDDFPPLGVNIDVEWTKYGGKPANPTTSDANQAFDMFFFSFGRNAQIYTAKGYSDDYLIGFNRYDSLGLWVANYGVINPLLPVGATTYQVHQFTSNLPGSIAPCQNLSIDGNYFNGTKEEFEEFYNVTVDPLPTPEGDTMPIIGIVLATVNLRAAPVDGRVIGYLSKGQKIKATEHQFQWLHISEVDGVPVSGWASAGANKQYIQWEEVPVVVDPPPTGTEWPEKLTAHSGTETKDYFPNG